MKSEEFITEEFTKEKGTYAGLHFSKDTIRRMMGYARKNKVPNILGESEFHSTLLYSRKFLPEYEPAGNLDTSLFAIPEAVEIWESPPNAFKKDLTNCLILKYKCQEQEDRFDELMTVHEASYDYDEYKTHVTLSYNVGDLQVEDLTNPAEIGDMEIIEEYSEELNLDKVF